MRWIVACLAALSCCALIASGQAISPAAPIDWSVDHGDQTVLPILDTTRAAGDQPVLLPLPPEAWAGATVLGGIALVRLLRRVRRSLTE